MNAPFDIDRERMRAMPSEEWPANSGAPPVLAAFGAEAAHRLRQSGLGGTYVYERWICEAAA